MGARQKFVRPFKPMPEPRQEECVRETNRVTLIGLVLNLVLSALKVSMGWLGASYAVVADGVHSLSDCATDIAILVGVRYWSAPPDEDHPHGHQRIETLVTISIGVAYKYLCCFFHIVPIARTYTNTRDTDLSHTTTRL